MVAALSHTGNVSHDLLPFLVKEYDSGSYEGLAETCNVTGLWWCITSETKLWIYLSG